MLGQILVGVVYANLAEVVAHKYVLHWLGKKKGSFWSFHWHDHHRNSRKNKFYDESYNDPWYSGSRVKEIVGIAGLVATHAWLAPTFPAFAVTTAAYSAVYLWAHRKAHLDPEWCKRWLPWHYDHHMGKNQDANWGVLLPCWDWIIRSREKM